MLRISRLIRAALLISLFCTVFASAANTKRQLLDHAQPSRIHDLFVEQFQGGVEGLLEALRERSDWSPLQIFEYQSVDQWGVKWDRFNAMGPVVQCPKGILESFGSGDGEKRICGNIKNEDCVVISVGSNNMWDFEEAVVAKYPQCRIHTLDCFAVWAKVPPAIQKQVTLHPICLGLQDAVIAEREFMTWPSVAAKIGLTKPPSALKMDIEGFEWTTIPAIIKSNVLVPESFSFELHYKTNVMYKDLVWATRLRTDPEIGLFMELLYNFGYVLVDRHDNVFCPHCSEIVVAKLAPNSRFSHHLRNTLQSNFAGGSSSSSSGGSSGSGGNATHPNVLNVDPYPTLRRPPAAP